MKHNTKTFLALSAGRLLLAVAVSPMMSSSENAKAVEGAEYLGCFDSNTQDLVLEDQFDDEEMTPEVCVDYCTGLGATLMAMKNAYECWCSYDGELDYDQYYDMTGEDAVCDLPCMGDEEKTCGGFDFFDLYKLTSPLSPCSETPVAAYEQCGGSSWAGLTCCNDGYECVAMGDGDCYSQCRPVSVAESTPSPVADEDSTPAPVVVEEPMELTAPPTVDEIVPDWPVPESDFDFNTCDENAWMCCWTKSQGMVLKKNTDVCRSGDLEFPGDSEGDVHCHGFAWADHNSDLHIRGLAGFVKDFNHEGLRKYYGNIEGAPTCGCVESMPEVSKSDCNTYNEDRELKPNRFRPCDSNDLRQRYELLNPDGKLANLVGKCDNA